MQQEVRNTVKTVPVVKSLVALQRDSCTVERDSHGCFITFYCSALEPGEATAYFLASGGGDLAYPWAVPQAEQVSSQRFDAGKLQSCRLFLSSDLQKGLEGFKEEQDQHQLVLDLRVSSNDCESITAQRSFIKFTEGDAPHVVKQMVQCGSKVRCLDALYGTLPNPRRVAGGASGDDGGDCVICLSKPREVVILHCRHVCLCMSCAKITSSTWSFQCPVCRGRVTAMVGLDGAAACS